MVLLNVPFGLLTVPLALKWLPRTARRAGSRPALDLVGLALLATATIGVLLPFVLPDGQGPPRPRRCSHWRPGSAGTRR